MNTKHLDIGCGSSPRNPFNCDELYGVDIIEQNSVDFTYKQCNVIFNTLPFNDSTFDSVSAYDFLEHVPRTTTINNQGTFPFIHVMNEAYRVLKPGGTFYAITPGYPRAEAFVDPTHVNFITKKTHVYFTSPKYKGRMYGFNGKFEVIRKVKWIKLTQETKKTNLVTKLIKNMLYTILYKKKSHLLWEFRAIKDE
jgi:SAM-dependent methyltransferase